MDFTELCFLNGLFTYLISMYKKKLKEHIYRISKELLKMDFYFYLIAYFFNLYRKKNRFVKIFKILDFDEFLD